METRLKEVEQERARRPSRASSRCASASNEVRLKEQEARLTEEQFAQQLAEAGARRGGARGAARERHALGRAAGRDRAGSTRRSGRWARSTWRRSKSCRRAQERKTYLDAQSQDLTEAMATLEDAIRRIDRETRERLQTTFDEVNAHFGQMFPALFGGGHARLVLTGEEILDAGVQVIAQPPGKKNTLDPPALGRREGAHRARRSCSRCSS